MGSEHASRSIGGDTIAMGVQLVSEVETIMMVVRNRTRGPRKEDREWQAAR